MLAEIAIFAALGFALDIIQGGIWRGVFINGGSIGFGMIPLAGLNAGIGFVGGVGGNLINGSDFSNSKTWIDISVSTITGFVIGLIGGKGATHAKNLYSGKRTAEFLKAAASYDRVLSKIAAGSYKNLAGTAEARSLTSRALAAAWSKMALRRAGIALAKSLTFTGVASFTFSTIKGYCLSLMR